METNQQDRVQKLKHKSLNKDLFMGGIALAVVAILIGANIYFKDNKNDNSNQSTVVEKDPSYIVATVNGKEITQTDVTNLVNSKLQANATPDELAQNQDEALDALINQEVLYQYASQTISITDQQIQDEYNGIKTQFPTEEEFNAKMIELGLNNERLNEVIKQQLTLQGFTTDFEAEHLVVVEEQEMQDLYKEVAMTNDSLPPFEEVKDEVKAQLIQVKQQEQLITFVENLRNQADIKLF